ncbi:Arrestin domain-containing protein 3 [Aphelenchoides avenae]|nr:Arrestin domain-containing protein 3 [Aphelenchus avenae]
MVKLVVRLHSAAAVFMTGEQVKGEVIAQVESPTKVRRISVHVFGHAYNQWGHGKHVAIAEVQFINVLLVLWKPSDGNVGVIKPGKYCFPFSFVVPPNALPNHRGSLGCIDYWCKAIVDRPWSVDNEVTFPFVVTNIVDLNAMPEAPNAVRISLTKEVGCCSKSGVISAEGCIDKFGYVGGEEMHLRVDIDNASSETVRTIQIRVVEEWVYTGHSAYPSLYGTIQASLPVAKYVLSFNEAVSIEPQNKDRYERRIKLPPLQPSYACAITVHNFYVEVLTVLQCDDS